MITAALVTAAITADALPGNRHDNRAANIFTVAGVARFIEESPRHSARANENFESARKPITKAALT